jgi:hypothetical protein
VQIFLSVAVSFVPLGGYIDTSSLLQAAYGIITVAAVFSVFDLLDTT